MQKNNQRRNEKQKTLEKDVSSKLNDLFDIAAQDILNNQHESENSKNFLQKLLLFHKMS